MGSISKPYYEAPGVKLYLGDSRQLPVEDESIDMIATSPPYWGKRDYGEDVIAVWGGEDGCEHIWGEKIVQRQRGAAHGAGAQCGNTLAEVAPTVAEQGCYCSLCGAWRGQLGLEPTWQEYIAHLCECAEEWWRVLKPTGNLFVNIGDTFAGSPAGNIKPSGFQQAGKLEKGKDSTGTIKMPPRKVSVQKMKLGIPYRLRFALNDMGWVSRDDIIWYKGKEYPDGKITKVAMPESVKDRMSCSYEPVLHFVKSRGNRCERYWWDLDAVRRQHLPQSLKRVKNPLSLDPGGAYADRMDGEAMDSCHPAGANPGDMWHWQEIEGEAFILWLIATMPEEVMMDYWREFAELNELPKDVWIIQPEPFKEKHYACWPSALCEMMIKAGCPKEVCPKCGKPRERIQTSEWESHQSEKAAALDVPGSPMYRGGGHHQDGLPYRGQKRTIGWSDCGCGEGFVPGVALDPFFGGSYRIAKEALKLGRNVIGVDMKEEYLEMAKDIAIYGEKGLSKEKERRKKGATQAVLL